MAWSQDPLNRMKEGMDEGGRIRGCLEPLSSTEDVEEGIYDVLGEGLDSRPSSSISGPISVTSRDLNFSPRILPLPVIP